MTTAEWDLRPNEVAWGALRRVEREIRKRHPLVRFVCVVVAPGRDPEIGGFQAADPGTREPWPHLQTDASSWEHLAPDLRVALTDPTVAVRHSGGRGRCHDHRGDCTHTLSLHPFDPAFQAALAAARDAPRELSDAQ